MQSRIGDEFIGQKPAAVQSGASIREIATALDRQKQVLDIFVYGQPR